MPADTPNTTRFTVARLPHSGSTPFALEPDTPARAALAAEIGVTTIRKLRFIGSLSPKGRNDWILEAQLGATVVQPCGVTLEPVTTRIDTAVVRRFVPSEDLEPDTSEPDAEVEMLEDDTLEPLGQEIDLKAIMAEAVSLALPAYPRKTGVELTNVQVTEEGVTPLSDEDLKPFAGLAGLRDKLQGDDSKS